MCGHEGVLEGLAGSDAVPIYAIRLRLGQGRVIILRTYNCTYLGDLLRKDCMRLRAGSDSLPHTAGLTLRSACIVLRMISL